MAYNRRSSKQQGEENIVQTLRETDLILVSFTNFELYETELNLRPAIISAHYEQHALRFIPMLYLLALYNQGEFKMEAVFMNVLVDCRKHDLYRIHLGKDEIIRSAVETLVRSKAG